MTNPTDNVTCPTCGMTIDPTIAAQTLERNGRMYYFCSDGCAAAFASDPKE